jgi:hypothetical protein
VVKIMAKTLDNSGIGVSQQLVNTHSTTIQHPDSVRQSENGDKLDMPVIQALTKLVNNPLEKRGRERVLNPFRLKAYYKLLCKRSEVRGKLSLLLPLLAQIGRLGQKSNRVDDGARTCPLARIVGV